MPTSVSLSSLCTPVLFTASSFFFYCYGAHRDLHSFPTRRSSDLHHESLLVALGWTRLLKHQLVGFYPGSIDRKSTRLNSSHRCISYAVFCLKKKKKKLRSKYTANKDDLRRTRQTGRYWWQ